MSAGQIKSVQLPLDENTVEKLRAGDEVLLSGIVYTGRDAAHQRMHEALDAGQPLPVDLVGQVIYYVGPAPAPPGRVIGSAGPTTAGRMDPYTPELLALGLKGMIGKGERSPGVLAALKQYKAVYFVAIGGLGALLAERIKSAEVVAYADLGPEAIYRLEVEDFPVTVGGDCLGHSVYDLLRC